ncbi:4-hydroxybenzoate 3-monooxygenase [Tomitella gaofuii]|uniref:4-hydroxybenzoate 3-monooxygenase n=1 Tax=Tomitella gaofuii TaxID=2760083 RepID=UPI0015FDDBCF|nr:4-hydroxybenzoate 3-monooxygenase [Tomitella gaofuii]
MGTTIERATVGIVGAGPAGLMLAHLLARAGIDTVAIDVRTRHEIETTHRAGILEQDSMRLLVDSGVSDRVLRDGHEHKGIELRFDGRNHRIDFHGLTGASTYLYPQTDVFIDLADARERDGGDVRFGVSGTAVTGIDGGAGQTPTVRFTDADGARVELRCDYVVGADGSHGTCRKLVPETLRRRFFREYPFAWFGVMVQAPPSAPELIYNRSERGFALISQRTEDLQRMYFQCSPGEDPDAWSDDRVLTELQARVAGGDGFELKTGPIAEKTVLPFRSFVQEPMRYGYLLLAGDAAHTVPPTGAKGLNLALADVRLLAEILERAVHGGDPAALDEYTDRALDRVWKAQHFSYWMTTMMHSLDPSAEVTPFDERRQVGELRTLVESESGRRFLAEGYTGWPGR